MHVHTKKSRERENQKEELKLSCPFCSQKDFCSLRPSRLTF
jgi:hypothetical protein